MYNLINNLKEYKTHFSVYPFGEFVHYSDKKPDFKSADLHNYLAEKGLKNIHIKETKATIEDTFMALSK